MIYIHSRTFRSRTAEKNEGQPQHADTQNRTPNGSWWRSFDRIYLSSQQTTTTLPLPSHPKKILTSLKLNSCVQFRLTIDHCIVLISHQYSFSFAPFFLSSPQVLQVSPSHRWRVQRPTLHVPSLMFVVFHPSPLTLTPPLFVAVRFAPSRRRAQFVKGTSCAYAPLRRVDTSRRHSWCAHLWHRAVPHCVTSAVSRAKVIISPAITSRWTHSATCFCLRCVVDSPRTFPSFV